MPEAKNTFIQSKMNKDMDGRILPNGQYRDGENVQISRSEGDDVGALETVLGNVKLTDFGLSGENLKTIGSYFDDNSNRVFLFLTNYTDSSPNQLDNEAINVTGVFCYIVSYNVQTKVSSILVEGSFLNFSQTHHIVGVNLLENLLFFTDNRNQPRKIDINLAGSNYYYTEDQISVAKYYPYKAPLLMKFIPGSGPDAIKWESTMTDTTSEYLPIHTAAQVKNFDSTDSSVVYLTGCYTNIMPKTPGYVGQPNGCLITGQGVAAGTTLEEVLSIDTANNVTTIKTSLPISGGSIKPILYFQFKNPEYSIIWPGDPEYLKEKFVRFSYRFKFDNNEYSLIAPFTQTAFIPQQDGYFIGDKYKLDSTVLVSNEPSPPSIFGQEAETFDSTVVPFMQNKVTNIEICLISPTNGNDETYINWSQLNDVLKVIEVDILIKDSSSNNVYVVETLGLSELKNVNSKYLLYDYQSKKPWRVLPTDQVTRVSDVIPLRALAQEISGNRVIYANFVEKNASPERLDYYLSVGQKPFIPDYTDGATVVDQEFQYVRKEYQNHTLKQNRTYQVGVVLSDRYGRRSNVILSELVDFQENPSAKKNSTIFHNYADSNNLIIYDKNQIPNEAANTWPGDNLSIVWNNVIPEEKTNDGYPGVYSINDGTLVNILVNPGLTATFPANSSCTFDVTNSLFSPTANAQIKAFSDADGNVSEIEIKSSDNNWVDGMEVVAPWQGSVFPCPGWVGESFRGNAVCPADRPLGWYSYNIVVKQTEQEYYNVYMPSALAGYPCNQNIDGKVDDTFGETPKMIYPLGQQNATSHLTLIGDNINKVPRDLNEVGPEQKSFRSSERLFHRVEGILLQDNNDDIQYSSQSYSPSLKGYKVVTISNMSKLDLGNLITNPAYPILPNSIYKAETDPFIARISTDKKFGIVANSSINGCITIEKKVDPDDDTKNLIEVNNTEFAIGPTLSVSETKPVESLLDIFWETSSSGLISDLNEKIKSVDNTAPSGFSPVSISWSEGDPYGSSISGQFSAVGPTGLTLVGSSEISLIEVTRGDNVPCIDQFELVQLGFGEVELKIAAASQTNPGFLHWQDQLKNQYTFKFELTNTTTNSSSFTSLTGYLSNKPPVERLEAVNSNGNNVEINWVDVKESICVRGDLDTQSKREDAQTMSLKAVQGSQKFGIRWDDNPLLSKSWRSYVDPESSFSNTTVNFGVIEPTTVKYINAAPYFNESSPCCVDTNEDSGDIRQSGMYDFGWFGGPTLPGTQDSKNGDGRFRPTTYQPGDSSLNSCTYSQKIYAPDPSLYPINNDNYPVSGNSGEYLEMPKYFRGATGWSSQPDIKFNSSILEETAFTKDVQTNTGTAEWDGSFAVMNGEFGSEILESWPNINGSPSGIGTALEIQWSIPRMYQVSMMIPHGNEIPFGNTSDFFFGTNILADVMDCYGDKNFLTKFPFDQPYYWEMPSRTSAPLVIPKSTGAKYFDVQPAGEVVFGLIPETVINSLSNSDRNAILKYIPRGPIYWDNSSNSTRAGFQGESQLDPENKLGEQVVGFKQNAYQTSDSANEYPHHYWPDINGLLQNDPEGLYSAFKSTPSYANAPDFMKIRNGANTFYQFNLEHTGYISKVVCGDSDQYDFFPYYSNAAKTIGNWAPNASQVANAMGHLFYLGGINNSGYGSSTNGQAFFIQPEQTQPGYQKAKAKIHAGTPGATSQSWNGPNAFGVGLPGGRYVVTVRATDVGGDGAFVEWDVPVYLPWWSTRTNTPLRLNP